MINLRFHIVSLVAVFLALAIGILTGSTLLDRATIQVLEDRQASLDRRNTELHDELDRYKANTQRRTQALDEFGSAALPELVPGLITDDPLLVVAARGVDTQSVTLLQQLLSDAGAETLGTVWYDERLDLTDADRIADLADVLDLDDDDPDPDADDVVQAFVDTVFNHDGSDTEADGGTTGTGTGAGTGTEAGGETNTEGGIEPGTETGAEPGAEGGGESESTTGATPSRLRALADAELLDWVDSAGERTTLTDLPEGDVRLVFVSGAGATLDDDAFLYPMIEALAVERSGVVVAEVQRPLNDQQQISDDTFASRGTVVDPIRENGDLEDRVITIDNADEAWGRLATVLALSGVTPITSGAYGITATADQVLPDITG